LEDLNRVVGESRRSRGDPAQEADAAQRGHVQRSSGRWIAPEREAMTADRDFTTRRLQGSVARRRIPLIRVY
jgi:hypothetical protein